MNIKEKIKNETQNVIVEIKEIAPHEWGGDIFPNQEDYKRIVITFRNGEMLHTAFYHAENPKLPDEFCKELNEIWGDDRQPYSVYDVLTGFKVEFPKDWDNNNPDECIINEIRDLAIKYYLIAKYDNAPYKRRGFNIYEEIEWVQKPLFKLAEKQKPS